MYSLMSSRTSARSSSNMNWASARASSVFPTPVGPRKTNEPIGRFGSCRPARAPRRALATPAAPAPPPPPPPQRVGDGRDGLVLPHDALVQPLLHVDQLLGLAFQQPVDGDPGPARDYRCDVVLVDLLLHHRRPGLVASLQLALELGQLAVADLGHALELAVALRPLGLAAQLVDAAG